jgi:1,2-phenylacetyl-CoA epoxidase catalytic subunit
MKEKCEAALLDENRKKNRTSEIYPSMYKEMSFHVQFTTRKLNSHFEQITYFSS